MVKWAMQSFRPAKMHVTKFIDKRMNKFLIKPVYLKRDNIPKPVFPGSLNENLINVS